VGAADGTATCGELGGINDAHSKAAQPGVCNPKSEGPFF
jgi:hypothetical protein